MPNYPTALGYTHALHQAAADPRWSEEERAALAEIAGDAHNVGEPAGAGRSFEARGLRVLARHGDRGVDLEVSP